MKNTMEKYLQALKRQRLKITPQRRAVIAFLLRRKTHASPYDVYAGVKKNIPRLGLPTIYRILEEMRGIGLLTQVLSPDRRLYYSLCAHPEKHHHHFTCRKCRRVEEVGFCNFKDISRFIEKNIQGKVESHLLQIEGLCSSCK